MEQETGPGVVRLSKGPLSEEQVERLILDAVRVSGGAVTETDLVVRTGVPREELASVLRRVMLHYDCSLEVRDDGVLVYRFAPDLRLREPEGADRWRRRRAALWRWFKAAFKVVIALVLIVYVVVFVLLMIAAVVALFSARAAARSSDDMDLGGDWGGNSDSGGGFWFWYWIFGRDASSRRSVSPTQDRWASNREREDTRPFYRKIYSFVFGPEEAEVAELFTERELLSWIRREGGVITPTMLTARTGWSLAASERESTRLLAAYEGDVHVTEQGEILYLFPSLLDTAGGEEVAPAPEFWRRWERQQSLTGNSVGANVLITLMNAFVFFGAFWLIPGFVAPVLGMDLSGGMSQLWLFLLPALYSLTFFAVPLLRWVAVLRPENRRRAARNVRRGVLRQVYGLTARNEGVDRGLVAARAIRKVPEATLLPHAPEEAFLTEFDATCLEFDAEPERGEQGEDLWRFERIYREREAAQTARRRGLDRLETELGEAAAFEEELRQSVAEGPTSSSNWEDAFTSAEIDRAEVPHFKKDGW